MPTFPIPPESAFVQFDLSKHPYGDKALREKASAELRERLGGPLAFTFTTEVTQEAPDLYRPDDPCITVHTKVSIMGPNGPVAIDRNEMMGYQLRRSNSRLKARLMKAIHAGAVFPNPLVVLDIYGKSYVQAGFVVFGKTMGADLRRLGF